MSVQWESVYVFISSTFNDMHAERDLLIKAVFPQLQEWCERRRLRLVDIDLRWGVTEADATQNKRVVQVCLERIDACRPFFLCLLGQRRGWVPKKGDISTETYAEYPELEQLAGSASVTEMEIVHALINPLHRAIAVEQGGTIEATEPAEHAFFYLRQPGYLDEIPTEPPQLRHVYTNEGIASPVERQEADAEVQRWRQTTVPQTHRPIHEYTCHWDSGESTPEIRLPLQCPTTAEFGSPAWQSAYDRWADQWAGFDVQVSENGDIEDPVQRLKGERANDRLARGRLSQFTCETRSLADAIVADLKAAIRERYPQHTETADVTPLQREIDQQAQFLQLASEGFIERSGDFDALCQYTQGHNHHVFVLTAPAGMGKTTLLARWIDRQKLRQPQDQAIFYRFVGASDGSTRVEALLSSLLEEMAMTFGVSVPVALDPEKLRTSWLAVAADICQQGDISIVIDSLDQLETGLSDLQWLSGELPEQIRLVVSLATGSPGAEGLLQSLTMTGQTQIDQVHPFSSLSDRQELVQAYLSRYLKDLDADLLGELIQQPGAENPLYLKVLLSELRVFGIFQQLPSKINEFGHQPSSAFQAVLQRMETDPAYSQMPPRDAIPVIFGALAAARHGLSVREMASVLLGAAHHPANEYTVQAAEQTIYTYLRQMRPYLSHRDGRFDFFYDSFRLAASCRYQELLPGLHAELVREFVHRSDPSGTHDFASADARALEELPFHVAGAGMKDELADVLGSLAYLNARCRAGNVYGLLADFGMLPNPRETSLYYGFLRKNAQKLTRYPNLLFSLLAFEGNEEQKREAGQWVADDRWPDPWISLRHLPFDEDSQAEAGQSLQVTARFDHERSCAVDAASLARLSFWVRNIGEVMILNTSTMEPYSQVLSTARKRPLAIRCSPHGAYLALAYDDGEAEVIRIGFADDGAVPYQTPAGSLQYYVPEVEAPLFWWAGDDLWYQADDRKIARRRFTEAGGPSSAIETLFDLPPDLHGELSLVLAHGGELLLGLRQDDNTLLAALADEAFVVLGNHARSDVACYAYDPHSNTAAVAFSDHQVVVYDTSCQASRIGQFTAPDDVRALNCDGGTLVLVTRKLAVHAVAIAGAGSFVNLVEEGRLSAKTISVYAQCMRSRGPGKFECTTDIGVVQLELAAGTAEQSGTWKALFTRPDGECLAARLQGQERRLSVVDFAAGHEDLLSSNGGNVFVVGVDGQGDLLAAHISGLGVFRTVAGEIYNFTDLPPGGISLAGDARSGFWLCEEKGNIYRCDLEGQAKFRLFTDLRRLLPSGSAISAYPGYLIWQGVTTMSGSATPDAEVVVVAFRTDHGRFDLSATLPFPKAQGRFMCCAFDALRRRVFAVIGVVGTPKCIIRYGTFEELAAGRGDEIDLEMEHEPIIHAEYLGGTDAECLLLLSGRGNLFVVDLGSRCTIASLCPESPVTRLSARVAQQHPTYCAINDKHIYQCNLERPA